MEFTSRGRDIPASDRVNHAALYTEREEGPCVLGANENGVTWDTLENFLKGREVVAVFSPRDPARTLWGGFAMLRDDLNERYNFGGLAGMAAVEIAREVFHRAIANPFDQKDRIFCSEFSVEVIRASGFTMLPGIEASAIDPQQEMAALMADTKDFAYLGGANALG